MLRVTVFFVCLLCQTRAETNGVKYRCNVNLTGPDEPYTTFSPSRDRVQGRYTAEYCTVNEPRRSRLTMDLTYNDNLKMCDPDYRRNRKLRVPGRQHSSNTVNVAGLTNCSHVCYSMDFDLIFSSCYLLKTTLNEENRSHMPVDSYYLINNNMTKEIYDKAGQYVSVSNHEDYFTLKWFLGIPAVDYNVTLHKIKNDTGEYLNEVSDVTRNCTLSEDDVRHLFCKLAPPYGCYQASLEHGGLWTAGVFFYKKIVTYDHLCYLPVPPVKLSPRSAALWWACGAALLAGAALVAGLRLRTHLRLRDYHKRVLDFWFNNRSSDAEAAAPVSRDSRDVLLLYAREGELGQQAVAALKDLIHHSTGGTVYDIFSPQVMAMCGAAPHTWVRALLARPGVRVLLLQAPAMAALYQDQLAEDEGGLRLRSPLLGRRAVYRAPHFGDQLLKMALRHIAETADTHHDYHKYYFATYQDLETDILPSVVSYRRYVLPGAARALGADLGGAPPHPDHLQQLERALHAHTQHVQHNPHYLMDEIFIN